MINTNKMKLGIFRQPKTGNHWNNGGTSSSTYKMLLYEAGQYPQVEFKNDVGNWTNDNRAMNSKYRVYVNPYTGLVTLPFNGVATKDTLHFHLVAALQSVTQNATSPYRKTIKSGFNTGMVNFANNEGHLFSIAGQIGSGDGFILQNAILSELTLSFQRDAEGMARLLNINGTWVGRNLVQDQAINNFTNTNFDNNNIFSNMGSQEGFEILGMIGDYDLEFQMLKWKKLELKVTNNINIPFRSVYGWAGNYAITQSIRFSVQFILDDYTKNVLSKIMRLYQGAVINIPSNLTILNGYGISVLGELRIDLQNLLIDTNPIGTENNYFIGTLEGEVLGGNSATNEEPIIIYLSDGQNIGY